MKKPPKEIDGAKTLEWAWSGNEPFGVLLYTSGEVAAEIYGLAICQYQGSGKIYRFTCNSNWETEQDAPYFSVQEAKAQLPEQFKNIKANWQKFEESI